MLGIVFVLVVLLLKGKAKGKSQAKAQVKTQVILYGKANSLDMYLMKTLGLLFMA
jgi:hypothetical protein